MDNTTLPYDRSAILTRHPFTDKGDNKSHALHCGSVPNGIPFYNQLQHSMAFWTFWSKPLSSMTQSPCSHTAKQSPTRGIPSKSFESGVLWSICFALWKKLHSDSFLRSICHHGAIPTNVNHQHSIWIQNPILLCKTTIKQNRPTCEPTSFNSDSLFIPFQSIFAILLILV
jgi:hypothetical protein